MKTASWTACAAGVLLSGLAWAADAPPNTLTAKEKAEGWKLLFDGKTTDGWRGYKKEKMPDGWKVENGALARAGGGGDIVTIEQFDNFELSLEWKISEGGNSGIMYHVTEEFGAPYETGPEMQVLDNAKHGDGKNPLTSAGACYALYPPVKDVTKPVGEWNLVKLVCKGAHVEHWLNGTKLLEYEYGSDEWNKKIEGSKFKAWPKFGKNPKGHIDLQDHGNLVWFRNIKIRVLK
jgi:hypothetical protein